MRVLKYEHYIIYSLTASREQDVQRRGTSCWQPNYCGEFKSKNFKLVPEAAMRAQGETGGEPPHQLDF